MGRISDGVYLCHNNMEPSFLYCNSVSNIVNAVYTGRQAPSCPESINTVGLKSMGRVRENVTTEILETFMYHGNFFPPINGNSYPQATLS